jgi:hypothetical protein
MECAADFVWANIYTILPNVEWTKLKELESHCFLILLYIMLYGESKEIGKNCNWMVKITYLFIPLMFMCLGIHKYQTQ